MPAQTTSDEIAALLKILDTVERRIAGEPVSNIQQLNEIHEDELANSATPDRSKNRFVERIAAAMVKLSVQGK